MKNLKYIFKPRFWSMNYPYNKMVDALMIDLINNHEFTEIKHHTAMLGGYEIWIDNYPYASMVPYEMNVRPSRRTIELANDKLIKAKIKALKS